jgi:hypothetical protein
MHRDRFIFLYPKKRLYLKTKGPSDLRDLLFGLTYNRELFRNDLLHFLARASYDLDVIHAFA